MFQSMTVGKKLWLMSALMLLNISIVGGVSAYITKLMSNQMAEVAKVELPAIRDMISVDMMHEGIRAVAYRAIIISGSKDEKATTETKEEIENFSTNISKYLANIEGLHIREETKREIQSTIPLVEAYKVSAKNIVQVALSGQVEKAIEKMPEFQDAFEKLGIKLKNLDERIEAEANQSISKSDDIAYNSHILNIILGGGGVILGFFLSFWVNRNLTTTLSTLTERLRRQSKLLNDSATSITSSSSELLTSSDNLAGAVQKTAASLEEINAMVSKTSQNSSELAKTVQLTHQASSQGQESVSEMLSSMDIISTSNTRIITQVEEGNKKISEIVKVIAEIGEKTKVINDIVFQTKLLSFNASVEAARAGEHGKGFAVVAEEVGNLAQLSGNAAKEISNMLTEGIEKANRIVADTQSTVNHLMQEGKSKIDKGIDVAKLCGNSLQEISRQISDINEMTAHITTAISEQTVGLQEISQAIHMFNQSTQQTSEVAKLESNTAEDLMDQASSLKVLVGDVDALVRGRHLSSVDLALEETYEGKQLKSAA